MTATASRVSSPLSPARYSVASGVALVVIRSKVSQTRLNVACASTTGQTLPQISEVNPCEGQGRDE